MANETQSSTPTQTPALPPVYFAVGPYPHEVVCPYCKQYAKTRTRRLPCLCGTKRSYCSSCGEYLGAYRRPKM